MTRTIHTLCAAALLLAATACEDTLQTAAPTPGNGPTLTLRIDNEEEGAQTRTDLENADPTNNVRSVRILIFQGGTEADNYNDAAYVGEETITEKEWPEKTTRYEYTLKSAFVDGQTYTLLGVGMDDTFSDTYAIDIDQNKTLGETYARLKERATPAQCEFFTGTVSFTQAGKNTQIDDLHLRRRVAGAMLYVNEIPQELTESSDNSTYRVTSARLVLGTPQKSSVLLKRDFAKKDWQEPDGQTQMSDDSKTLATIDFENNLTYTPGKDFYMDSETGKPATGYAGVYLLPLNKTEDTHTFTVQLWGKKDNLDGTFGEETQLSKQFIVENRSESNATAFDIRSNYIYCIGKLSPEQGIDAPISLSGEALYVEVQEWQKVETGHDFGPARVQAVFDDDEETIHNCMNEEFTINVLPPLETIRDRVESIRLIIDDGGNTIIKSDADGDVEILEKDMVYTDEQNGSDIVTADIIRNYYAEWLYVRNDNDQTYGNSVDLTDKLKGNDPCTVTFFIKDYARPRRNWGWVADGYGPGQPKWNDPEGIYTDYINHDTRRLNVYLETKIKDITLPRRDTLCIEQYNTITVYYSKNPEDYDYEDFDEGYADCGFSRYDKTELQANDGSITEKIFWGFSGTPNMSVYTYYANPPEGHEYAVGNRYDGSGNLLTAGDAGSLFDEDWWFDTFPGSAPGQAQYAFRKIEGADPAGNTGGRMTLSPVPTESNKEPTDQSWYLPAALEMEGIIYLASTTNVATQINPGTQQYSEEYYWSSTLAGDMNGDQLNYSAYVYHMTTQTIYNTFYDRREDYDHKCRIRQARKFPLKYGYAW